jgi:hypothetical protein
VSCCLNSWGFYRSRWPRLIIRGAYAQAVLLFRMHRAPHLLMHWHKLCCCELMSRWILRSERLSRP